MDPLVTAALLGVGLAGGLLSGTLGEYLMHRAMHARRALGERHARHHRLGFGQGWLGELIDYAWGGLPGGVALAAILTWVTDSPRFGGGFFIGVLLHLAFAAYAHQLQHERPDLVFWMRKPVHYLHHEHGLWHHNFGISTPLWDHVFGTYQELPFEGRTARSTARLVDYFAIDWGSPPKLDAERRVQWEEQARQRARVLRAARRERRQRRRGAKVSPDPLA